MKKKNILITGGAGFIGSHLVQYHLEKGNSVWTVDDLVAGSMQNIAPFLEDSNFQFDKADINDWANIHKAVDWADHIYHMAAVVGQKQVLNDPIKTLQGNIRACEALLEAISKSKTAQKKRFLLASTSSIYIHQEFTGSKGFTETSPVIFHSGEVYQETYPLGKFVDEVTTLSYIEKKGLDCVIVRIFNTIGPHQSSQYGFVVSTFVEQALRNEPLTVYGDGTQTRSFCNVQDTIKGFELLLDTPESKGQIVNVGNDVEHTILDLAKMIIAKAKSQSTIKFVPYIEAYGLDFKDVTRRRPNLEKLKKLTDYTPKISLEKTIEEIIAYKSTIISRV